MAQVDYFKVSYVVEDGSHTGAIISTEEEPAVGDEVTFDGAVFQITEVTELMPPVDDFGFLHVTVRYLRDLDQ